MPFWLIVLFAIIGALASLVGIVVGFLTLRDRLGSRLIVQVWWELALDPVHTRHFWHAIGIGAIPPVPEDEEEPAERVRFRQFDGVWVLRLLVYNPSQRPLDQGNVERIVIEIQMPMGIEVLSWQAKDQRLIHHRAASESRNIQTILLPEPMRPNQKIRDNLPVTFSSQRINQPPEATVDLETHVRSRLKTHRPSTTYSAAGWRLFVRGVRKLLGRAGRQPRLYLYR